MLAQWTSNENLAAPLARARCGGANPTAAQSGHSRVLRRGPTPYEREPGRVPPCAQGSGRSDGPSPVVRS